MPDSIHAVEPDLLQCQEGGFLFVPGSRLVILRQFQGAPVKLYLSELSEDGAQKSLCGRLQSLPIFLRLHLSAGHFAEQTRTRRGCEAVRNLGDLPTAPFPPPIQNEEIKSFQALFYGIVNNEV